MPLAPTGMSKEEAETTARVFRALADPHRVRIVNLLANADGPVCVCDITPQLGLSQPTVSFHLKLVAAGLLGPGTARGVGLLLESTTGPWRASR